MNLRHRNTRDRARGSRPLDVERLARCVVGLLALLVAFVVWPSPAEAETDPTETFNTAAAALKRGAYTEAIANLEQLSDNGIISANASYDRALAYLLRAESPKRKEGDLGQVVAGLREAERLQGGDEHVSEVLNAARREISRLRAQRGLDPVVVEPPLARAVASLLPEDAWAALTLLGSAVLCIGLLLLLRAAPQTPTRLAGQVSSAAGLFFALCFGSLAAASTHYRHTSQEAVVVASEAQLLDKTGKRLTTTALDVEANAIPEGASVFVTGRSGRLAQVNWGSFEAWVESNRLRLLAAP